ncbi:MAG: protein kinase [Myxococcota bacterium]|nr:protein kinase [Myxococcota bacterium]
MSRTSANPTLPVDPDLASGEVVGEYVVDGKLGQGAFGTVYRGAHPLIGKQVAIKVLARKYSVDPEITSRFIAEARAVNQIRHKNIIDIFSFGMLSDGRQYYVMEHLDGEPLDALIERAGKIGLADALPILRGVARALDAAHAKSIAHRDLKAENIFLASDGDGVWPKLLDFGIAKLLSDDNSAGTSHKTRTGYSIGTPYYMSPEQARGRDVDHRTDIYAFGVLAYVMLVGKYPFDGEDYMEILMHQLQDQPVPASTLVPELPASVDEAISWLMAKDPADRPPSLRDAIAAFERAAEESGINTGAPTWETGPVRRVTTAPPRIARPVAVTAETAIDPAPKRRAGLIAGLSLAIVAAGIGIVVVTRAPPEKPPVVVEPAPPPPPIQPPAPVVAPADAPEESRTITITVDGPPRNTEVLVAGVLIGTAPGPVQMPRDTDALVLTFKAEGFVPASREVTPDRDQSLSISLKKRVTGKRPTRDDLIDVFDK